MQSLARPLLAVLLFGLSALASHAQDMPVVDPADFVSKYGKPDQVRSTEYDKPRPPFVTRMLEYKKEHVRIVLLANAPMGSPPPYSSWKLMGYQDPRDNSVLKLQEAERRLAGRRKK